MAVANDKVNVVVDYFSLQSQVEISVLLKRIVVESNRTCSCNNRRLFLSEIEDIHHNGESLLFGRMVRIRHASYPIIIDNDGNECRELSITNREWIGEVSAFIYSHDKHYLLLIQNKSGVRQTCIAAYLSTFARKLDFSKSNNSVRLSILVKPGEDGTKIKFDKKVMEASVQRAVLHDENDLTVADGIAITANPSLFQSVTHEETQISINLKPKIHCAFLGRIINKLQNIDIPKDVESNTLDCLVFFNDFEVTDFLHNTMNYCGNYDSIIVRKMDKEMQKRILLDAWDFNPFVQNYRDVNHA